jgi:ATP-dependent DNA helicase PIF1
MTQSQALEILKTGTNVFLTGEPGSGKTHLINKYVSYLRSCGIDPAITASTGIAATHIGGMTIHSWSGIGIKSELSRHELDKIANNKKYHKRISEAKVLIIDEISMLPPEALNLVEAVCRRVKKNIEPFGGLQVIFVGDFFQLPPISKKIPDSQQQNLLSEMTEIFAYGSSAWQASVPMTCYLSEQYRQDDKDYLDLLSAIRGNRFNDDYACRLERRKINYSEAPQGLPKLFSHNFDVDRVNNEMLSKLSAKKESFTMTGRGAKALVGVLKRGCLSPEILDLKVGATVMFTKNSPKGLFVNGTLGKVERFEPGSGYPIVALRDGRKLKVEPMDWVLEENGEDVARITQLPLRLAWAITVHKSQGMSLDGAVMDLSTVFEYGQGYVAFSRVRRLSGLYLLGWNNRAFEVHPEIVAKDTDFKLASINSLTFFTQLPTENLKALQEKFINVCCGRGGQRAEEEIEDFYPLK